jgi:hypothetical protein
LLFFFSPRDVKLFNGSVHADNEFRRERMSYIRIIKKDFISLYSNWIWEFHLGRKEVNPDVETSTTKSQK